MSKVVYQKMLVSKDFGVTDDEQRIVEGIVTDDSIDIDGHVIDADAFRAALADYLKWGNIRDQHGLPVGKVVEIMDWNKFAVQIVDDAVWKKVKAGLYKGFSVGIRVLDVAVDDVSNYSESAFANVPKVMADMIRDGGFIFRITKMLLAEVSIVDRPANPRALITAIKSTNMDVNVKHLPSVVKEVGDEESLGEIKMENELEKDVTTEVVEEAIPETQDEVNEDNTRDEHIQQLESKVASLEKSVEDFATNLSGLHENLANMEGKLSTIDESLSKLVGKLEEKTVEVDSSDEVDVVVGEVSQDALETIETPDTDQVATKSMEDLIKKAFDGFSDEIKKSIAENVESALKKANADVDRIGGVNLDGEDAEVSKSTDTVTKKSVSHQIAEKLANMANIAR